jgi:PBSX family phage terminase large subunit
VIYTLKQRDLMRLWQKDKLKRINLLEGSVSSGKTWISLVLWAFWVKTMPASQDCLYLMCAKSLTTLKRNCLILLQELVGEDNFTFSIPSKDGELFGRKIILEGANDMRSESKIRGLTLQGAYCDELTQFPQDFFVMLLSRLRLSGAKLFATTNPDTPYHWLKQEYIDRQNDLDLLDIQFLLDDNTTLPQDYVTNVKREYTGVFYQRFILGKWVVAEGAIYQAFCDNPENYIINSLDGHDVIFATIGVDFGGGTSAHAFNCTAFTRGFKEIITVHDYRRQDAATPDLLYADFAIFLQECRLILPKTCVLMDVYCDSAEQTLIKGMDVYARKNVLKVNILNAKKKPINDRIRFYTLLMGAGRYKILRSCAATIDALSSAVWDSKHKTEDVRLDDGSTNIDNLDAQEYSTEPYMSDIIPR